MIIFKEVMIKHKSSAEMKTKICILALVALATLPPYIRAQETFRGGGVYGPKAAFNIDAPDGWLLDNNSRLKQGLPCVLYPKASSWSGAKPIMSAKISSPELH